MRLISATLIVFSGALMASWGGYSDAMPGGRINGTIDNWGLFVVIVGLIFFAIAFLLHENER